jgi:hypothetical protein
MDDQPPPKASEPVVEGPSAPEAPATSLVPNRADIDRHLYGLYQPSFVQAYSEAQIEIALGKPDTGNKINTARLFSAFALDKAGDWAEKKSKQGFNVYVGPALRRGDAADGRCQDADVLAGSHGWTDFDDAGDLERVDAILRQFDLQPSMVVYTGRTPHTRFQPYVQSADDLPPDQLTAVNKALHELLGGDAVHAPAHVMRLAGTINYLSPDKLVREPGRIPELVTLTVRKDALAYRADYLISIKRGPAAARLHVNGSGSGNGAAHAANGANGGRKPGRSDEELLALLGASQTPGQWHNNIRAAIASMLGRGWSDSAIRMTCQPYFIWLHRCRLRRPNRWRADQVE